jgi:hypothetical protein
MGSARFRIRANGREVEVGDMAELDRLVRVGRIGPATEIWDEAVGAWTVVGNVDGIDRSGDPWSAWDDIQEHDPVFAVAPDPTPESPPLREEAAVDPPLEAPTPVQPVIVQAIEEQAEAAAAEALVEDDEDLVPTGEVIAFPADRIDVPRGRRTSGAHALAERPVALPPQRPARPEPPRIRLSIVLGTSIIGFLGLGWWVWYVDTTSKASPGPASPPTAHLSRTIAEGVAEPPQSPARAQLQIVEEDLVRRLPEATRAVASESDLEMALNTELAALGIDVIEANAAVLSWTMSDPAEGTVARIPQVVEFRIRVRPAGAQLTDREQGAVALVIGRYIAAYDLVVTRFDLVVEAADVLPRTVPIDAMRAQRLAEGQLDLAAYLRVP